MENKKYPSPYDYRTLHDYCACLVQAGLAQDMTAAEREARRRVPKEAKIQSSIMAFLRSSEVAENGFFWKDAAGPYQQQGIPDIIGVYRGRFFAFEVKRPLLGRTTPLQEKARIRINQSGGYAYIVTSAAEVRAILGFEDRRAGA